jgi:ABC-type transporter Mla MlaB component
MLRITRIAEANATRLTLEGRLVGPWVGELASLCAEWRERASSLRLDLAAVSFADDAGVRLLQACLSEGATLVACSGIVAELLRGRPQ